MKPTSRLIVAVVILAFVMTLVLAGIGIGVSWKLNVDEVKRVLQRERRLMLDAIETFAVTLLQSQVV